MNLILDANQLNLLGTETSCQFVIPPYVFAEILLHQPEPFLQRLSVLNAKLGLEPSEALDAIGSLTEREIRYFEPFKSSAFFWSGQELNLARRIAHQMKQQHLQFCGLMLEKAKEFRKRLPGHEHLKFGDISEALSRLPSFKEMVVDWVRNGGARKCVVSDPNLYDAVMQNQYLGNFFRTILYYLISFSRAWVDQRHNFDPSDTRDDWTDITLPLYSSNGDFILTSDKKLRNAVGMIEPRGTLLAGPSIPTACCAGPTLPY